MSQNRLTADIRYEKLDQCKLELENNLRKNFAQLERSDLKNMEPLKPYNDYSQRDIGGSRASQVHKM